MSGSPPSRLRAAIDKAWIGYHVLRSRPLLRHCDVVGRWTRVTSGRPVIDNEGRIELGSRTRLTCEFGRIELRTAPGARLTIGSRTAINFSTLFDVTGEITVGDQVSIGPYCIFADGIAGPVDPDAPTSSPIVIEDGAWIASRVTVLPGARIGAGSVVTAGSIVDGSIPPGVVAGGIPARVLRQLGPAVAPIPTVDGAADDEPDAPQPIATPTPPAVVVRPAPMADGILISDFSIDPLARSLLAASRPVTSSIAPFGNVVPSLLSPPEGGRDFAVVWTRPEETLPSFRKALRFEPFEAEDLTREVDQFADLLANGLSGFRCVLVPTWTVPPWQRGRGLVDNRAGGVSWALRLANQRLTDKLAGSGTTFVLDAERWLGTVGATAYSERLHYLGKIPFVDAVFDEAAADIVAAIAATTEAPRKLVVLDLDNTLWGGVVGDVGWQDIRLGGHDAAGEAFVAFQEALKALTRRGILLGLASKNEESVALEAIDRHESMVLRRADLAGWRVNWSDKAANIAALAADLNLGLQSVVFIDDNPHERERVREALPEVLVPEWPVDPSGYVRALATLTCFDTVSVTAEDLNRTALYATEEQRAALRNEVGSIEDWLRDLQIVVTADPLGPRNLPRAAQLLNKTNQMNLTTRRLTNEELMGWTESGERRTWCVNVRDRLGDAGLTGLVSVDVEGADARLVDFVLSCRVMGRHVEDAMLHAACRMALDAGASSLAIEVLPTAKNVPCQRFFADAGLEEVGERAYRIDLAAPVPAPGSLTLELPVTAGPERT